MIREIPQSTGGRIVLTLFDGVRHHFYAFDDLEDAKKVLEMLSLAFGSTVEDLTNEYWKVQGEHDKYAELMHYPF